MFDPKRVQVLFSAFMKHSLRYFFRLEQLELRGHHDECDPLEHREFVDHAFGRWPPVPGLEDAFRRRSDVFKKVFFAFSSFRFVSGISWLEPGQTLV